VIQWFDPVATPATPPPEGPADLALGAFTPRAPWIVDPAAMPWRTGVGSEPGVDTLRRQAADLARVLVHPQHLPSLGRVLTVAWRIGVPLLAWGTKERGTPRSRAGLSRRLRPAFEHLGPTYIKLGQIISSGEGIFPEELVHEFHLLRDRVPPEPFPVVRRTIEEDLGRPLAEVFTSIDRTPLASASIAQVHSATLRTGERVVVKVQRSRVAPLVRLDIAAMAWIAPFLVGRIPVAALTNPIVAIVLFNGTMILWHLPAVYDWASWHQWAMDWVMAPMFVVVGYLFWRVILPSHPTGPRGSTKVQVAAVVVTLATVAVALGTPQVAGAAAVRKK